MMYVLKTYSTEEVIDIVDKLTMGYYTAIGIVVAIVSAVLIFAVWDRSTMKKAIQKEFEAKLEKETEKIKQETEIAVDEIIDKAHSDVYWEMHSQLEQTNKKVKTILEQETNKVKQELQTKVDELVETSNKRFEEKLKQSSKQMRDLSTLVDHQSLLRVQMNTTFSEIVYQTESNHSKLGQFKILVDKVLRFLNHMEKRQLNKSLHKSIWTFLKSTLYNVNYFLEKIYIHYNIDKDSTEDREKSKQQIKAINDTIDNINAKIADYPYFKDMDVTELYLNKINETKLFAGSRQSKPNKTKPS